MEPRINFKISRRRDSLLEKWRRFRNRPSKDRTLILQAAVFLPLTHVALRMIGFRRWKELIENVLLASSPSRNIPASFVREASGRAVRAVRSVEVHGPVRSSCLERSLTLWWLLRREGIAGELHVGARKQSNHFEAHAWVELDGQVLNDDDDVHQHYARFDAPIAAAAGDMRAGCKVIPR